MATVTAAQRRMFAKMKIAMPDGSFYVRNAGDLQDAIMSVGRGENGGDSGNAIRLHIITRAKALGLTSRIPATWNSDGSLKTAQQSALQHHGIKGMHWGVRKARSEKPQVESSEDSAETAKVRVKARASGKQDLRSLSNKELQDAITRLNLERQFSSLTTSDLSTGQKISRELLGTSSKIGKQQFDSAVNQYATKGVNHLVKHGVKTAVKTAA